MRVVVDGSSVSSLGNMGKYRVVPSSIAVIAGQHDGDRAVTRGIWVMM
jgi:hypothetical protein